jgi:hypothetical protein
VVGSPSDGRLVPEQLREEPSRTVAVGIASRSGRGGRIDLGVSGIGEQFVDGVADPLGELFRRADVDARTGLVGHEPLGEALLVVVHLVLFAVEVGGNRVGFALEGDASALDVPLPLDPPRVVGLLRRFVSGEVFGTLPAGVVVELAEDAPDVFDSPVPLVSRPFGEHPTSDATEDRILPFQHGREAVLGIS